jgi:hypothetical protein
MDNYFKAVVSSFIFSEHAAVSADLRISSKID